MSLIIEKDGLYLTVNDKKKRVKKLNIFSVLRNECKIADGVLLIDIFRVISKYKLLLMFFSQYSWCDNLEKYHEEAEQIDYEFYHEEDYKIEYLEISWTTDSNNWIDLSTNLDGKGICLKNKEVVSIGIDFSPMEKLANLEVKLNTEVKFLKNDVPVIEGQRNFSLLDILDAIYWEISFVGNSQDKKKIFDEIKFKIDEFEKDIGESI